MTLLELAERCEQATGPDRELDCRIWLAATGGLSFELGHAVVPDLGQWQAPAYTASLDAAMTLSRPNWWFSANAPLSPQAYGYSREDERRPRAGFEMMEMPYMAGARAETLPLAICAAALRARHSIQELA
jgi:hypothetical protein